MTKPIPISVCPHCLQDSGGIIGAMKHISKTTIEFYCVVCGKTAYKTIREGDQQ